MFEQLIVAENLIIKKSTIISIRLNNNINHKISVHKP